MHFGKCAKCNSNNLTIKDVKYFCKNCGHEGNVQEWIN
jgi:hypothetical protein